MIIWDCTKVRSLFTGELTSCFLFFFFEQMLLGNWMSELKEMSGSAALLSSTRPTTKGPWPNAQDKPQRWKRKPRQRLRDAAFVMLALTLSSWTCHQRAQLTKRNWISSKLKVYDTADTESEKTTAILWTMLRLCTKMVPKWRKEAPAPPKAKAKVKALKAKKAVLKGIYSHKKRQEDKTYYPLASARVHEHTHA